MKFISLQWKVHVFKEEVECDMMINKQEVTTLTDKTHFEVSRSVTL